MYAFLFVCLLIFRIVDRGHGEGGTRGRCWCWHSGRTDAVGRGPREGLWGRGRENGRWDEISFAWSCMR